jgi:copper(I)-binding protein
VNRVTFRGSAGTVGLAGCGIAAAMMLSGCSAGQISQTSTIEAAVNGASGSANNIALRDVALRATQSGAYLPPGKTVQLRFVASNGSPDTPDKLVGITSDVGTVTLTGDPSIAPSGILVSGAPDATTPLGGVEAANATDATVALTQPITNGLTYDFTFTFEKAGATTFAVPISAGDAPAH